MVTKYTSILDATEGLVQYPPPLLPLPAPSSHLFGMSKACLLLLSCIWLYGCEEGPSKAESRSNGVSTQQPARRALVSTMPSTTEILIGLGLGDEVVGVSRFCSLPLPTVGSGLDPDLERIVALRPDLVIGTIAQSGFGFVTTLEGWGIAIYLLDDRSLESLFSGVLELAELLGVEQRGLELVGGWAEELESLRQRTVFRASPRVLILLSEDPLYAAGPATFIEQLVLSAGGQNALESGEWVQLDHERLVRLSPDVIFGVGELDLEALRSSLAALEIVPAVRDGRIHGLNAPGLSRPGPGIVEAAQEIAAHLHPEVFLVDAP